MALSSPLVKHKKQPKPLPAHRCGSRVCCNFIVAPTRAKYKYQFCSDGCRRAQYRYQNTYSNCYGCRCEIKRETNRYYCRPCETKREERRAARIASGTVPAKPCAWLFCQRVFQPSWHNQKYCGDDCRKGAAGSGRPPGPGYPAKMPEAEHDYGFCTGNCGKYIYIGRTPHADDRRCDACQMGHRYGTFWPFGPPLPAGWQRCHWVFCHALYQPDHGAQRGCCSLHEQLPKTGAAGWPSHYRLGWEANHACANNCGTALYYTTQPVCLPCLLGLRYGRVNPFPVDADERARWGEQVVHFTEKQLAAEWDYLRLPPVVTVNKGREAFCGGGFTLRPGEETARALVSAKRQTNVFRPWLAGFIVGLGAWLVGASLRAKRTAD